MRVLVVALVCTACALLLLLGTVALAARIPGAWRIPAMIALPPGVLALIAVVLKGRGHAWRWPAAIAFRYADMVTWSLRYSLIFMLIGRPVGLLGGAALTVVSQAAMFTPIQLGLREWSIGIAAVAMPGVLPGADPTRADTAAVGMLADCVMRATELLIVLPLGLAASAWVYRRMRAAPLKGEAAPAQQDAGRPAPHAAHSSITEASQDQERRTP
jgi:hypothetical protein